VKKSICRRLPRFRSTWTAFSYSNHIFHRIWSSWVRVAQQYLKVVGLDEASDEGRESDRMEEREALPATVLANLLR
jgi:hypothetical protein